MNQLEQLKAKINYITQKIKGVFRFKTKWEDLNSLMDEIHENRRKIRTMGELAFQEGVSLSDNPFLGDTQVSRLWIAGYCEAHNKSTLIEKFGEEIKL